jgi:hypothetical protein
MVSMVSLSNHRTIEAWAVNKLWNA